MISAATLGANPIYYHVDGAPVQPRQVVRVVAAVDREVADVSEHIGRLGLVRHLNYNGATGNDRENGPLIGLQFSNGQREEFWPEEIEVLS